MPTFLAYQEQELVRLVMLYVDEEPSEKVEVHIEVASRARNQKIALNVDINNQAAIRAYPNARFTYNIK